MAGAAAAGATAALGRRAFADLSIDITRGQVQPLPIAITTFYSPDPGAAKVGADPADCWPVLQHLAANRPEIHAARGHDPATAVFQKRGG